MQAAVTEEVGLGRKLLDLLTNPGLDAEKVAFIARHRVGRPWLDDLLTQLWALDRPDHLALLSQRFTLHQQLRNSGKLLAARLLPDHLRARLEMPFHPAIPFEEHAVLIEHPELAVATGCLGLRDFAGLARFWETRYGPLPSGQDLDGWQRVQYVLSQIVEIESQLARVGGWHRSNQEWWSIGGLTVAILGLPWGAGTLPSLALFGLAWVETSRTRREAEHRLRLRLRELESRTPAIPSELPWAGS